MIHLTHFASPKQVYLIAGALKLPVPHGYTPAHEWMLINERWPEWLKKMLYVARRQRVWRGTKIRKRLRWSYHYNPNSPYHVRKRRQLEGKRSREEVPQVVQEEVPGQVSQDERDGVQSLAGPTLPAAQSPSPMGRVQEARPQGRRDQRAAGDAPAAKRMGSTRRGTR